MTLEQAGMRSSSGGPDAFVAHERADPQPVPLSVPRPKPAGLVGTWREPCSNDPTCDPSRAAEVGLSQRPHFLIQRQEGCSAFFPDTLAGLIRSAAGFVESADNPDILLVAGASDWVEQAVGNRRRRGEWLPLVGVVAVAGPDCSWRVLDAGADDCLVGPFAPPELVARLRAVLRRTNPGFGSCRRVEVDRESRQIRLDGVVARVSRRQFEIFVFLEQRRNRWVSSSEIIAAVAGTHHQDTTSLVRVHIHGLRKAHAALRSCIRSDGHRRYMFALDEGGTAAPVRARW